MIDIEAWSAEFAGKLRACFGPRLKFLGYQGSYGRGEAGEGSDIDIVAVLDRLGAEDLEKYRGLVREMPSGELACGFICGEEELRGWPKFDSLSVLLDTKPVYGELRPLMPAFTREDCRAAAAAGASGVYHGACHSYLYKENPAEALPGLGKAAFFCMRLCRLAAAGEYTARKADLLKLVGERERAILRLSMEPEWAAGLSPQEAREAFAGLIAWSGEMVREFGG